MDRVPDHMARLLRPYEPDSPCSNTFGEASALRSCSNGQGGLGRLQGLRSPVFALFGAHLRPLLLSVCQLVPQGPVILRADILFGDKALHIISSTQ